MLSLQEIIDNINLVAGEYPIRKAELFGSYAQGCSTPESDVDIIVEFDTPQVSLLTLSGVKCRLEELLQTPVDVVHGPLAADSMLEIDRRVPLYGA